VPRVYLLISVQNILVASINPWRVKLADFGVSKQLHEATQLQTQTGTPAYQAPELREASRDSRADMYSLSVDIWAIGVITMELILDHPFLYGADQRDYVEGRRLLSFDEVPGVTVSSVCQDLITGLLAPNAQSRPTVKDAISHSWFATATGALEEEAS
jgi:serine/threonine protein kinase